VTNPLVNAAGELYLLLGVLLFCAGTLLGIPHGLAKRSGNLKRTELWRVAHLSTCLGGVSIIALTLAVERLFPGAALYTVAPFSAAAFSFFLACTLSGWLNRSWDDDRSTVSVALIYGLQMFASALSVVAVGGFLVAQFLKVTQ
jgi:hypothetical protein